MDDAEATHLIELSQTELSEEEASVRASLEKKT